MTPADLLLWITLVTAAAGLIAGAYRVLRRHFARQARIEELLEHTERRSRQLETNGGSHLADAIVRLEAAVGGLDVRLRAVERQGKAPTSRKRVS